MLIENDAVVQNQWGDKYMKGNGVERDDAKAFLITKKPQTKA